MKVCSKCGIEKSFDCFGKNKRLKDGLAHWCKVCCSNAGKEQYQKNKQRVLEYQKQYRAENREQILKTKKVWKAKNREKVTDINRWSKRKATYGISKDQFLSLLDQQNHTCAICDRSVGISSCVDHCHNTGVVRGILCDTCNTALGMLGDDLKGLMRAVEYLKGVKYDIHSKAA